MSVKLISYTVPSNELIHNGICSLNDLIAYCARVSNPGNQSLNHDTSKLINYLIKNKHWSPLEMVNICLEIETTRDISRQIIRHRSFCFQEFSQRYAEPTKELGLTRKEARLQDNKNRQSSISCADYKQSEYWDWIQDEIIGLAHQKYNEAIKLGIAKEVARCILPEGLTKTRLYMNGSLRSWVHYIELRTRPETQKEHREIAEECAKVISEIFPLITEFCYDES